MDEIDRAILRELQQDARRSLSEVSQRVNLSLPAVSERLRKLERAQVVKQYTAILNPAKFGKELLCFCFLVLQNKTQKGMDELFRFVREADDILDCHCVTGHYEYMLKIHTRSTESLEQLLSDLRAKTTAKTTSTFIVLSTAKESHSVLP